MAVSIWILGDQLMDRHPALKLAEESTGSESTVVMIDSTARFGRLPYHRKKQVLLRSAMRHYAARLQSLGITVDYRRDQDFVTGLQHHLAAFGSDRLLTMAAAEYPTRQFQDQLDTLLGVSVDLLPNQQFLVNSFDPYPDRDRAKRVVMEPFYRSMRRHFNVLVEDDGTPVGGSWNYDRENRKRLRQTIALPRPRSFVPDEITLEVMDQVRTSDGVGSVDGFDYPVTRTDALAALEDFLEHRLPKFGPYEDAMTSRSDVVFHSVLSPAMNLGLLEPMEVISRAESVYRAGEAPVQSVEGFVRQILGWREFMFWQYWRQMPGLWEANAWDARRPLPRFLWNGETEMNCIRRVTTRVLDRGYSHHIERLMVVCTWCLLSGVDPQAVSQWFLSFYIDASEWVVLPNVIGMGLNADGGITATKPYIASGFYIDRMSDYCRDCRYSPRVRTGEDACPFTILYWDFLIKHEETLRSNPRLGPSVLGLRRIDAVERQEIRTAASQLLSALPSYDVPEFDANVCTG